MKENKKLDFSFWFSVFAIAISVVTLILFFVKVTPNSVIDISSFIGAIAAFIGISVTMVIGFQISNSLDLKNKIKAIKKLKQSLEEQKKLLNLLKIEYSEGVNIIQARLYYTTTGMERDAFLRLHTAIKYSLSVDHKQDGYDWILDELEAYMLRITMDTFSFTGGCLYQSDYEREVNIFKDLYKDEDSEIRAHPNYIYIKGKYEKLMSKFEKRLDNISNCKYVSYRELDKLRNETK